MAQTPSNIANWSPPDPNDPTLSREAHNLLAQANVLRMRGAWSEAIERCMEAMKLSPLSASAPSLLGDIYENQGRADDAIQWYRMALDINPQRMTDQRNLRRLQKLKGETPDDLPPTAHGGPASGPYVCGTRTRTKQAEGPGWVPIAAIAAGIGATLFLAYGLLHHPSANGADKSGPTALVSQPIPYIPTDSTTGVAEPGTHDQLELDLLQKLRSDTDLSTTGLQIVDVESDPRYRQLTITIACSHQSDTGDRNFILKCALKTAITAMNDSDNDSGLIFIVRALLVQDIPDSDSTPLVFVGTVNRSVLQTIGDPDAYTPTAIQSTFAPWWSDILPRGS